MKAVYHKIISSAKSALPKAGRTSWWLLKIILPISLAVTLLQYWGIIDWIAGYITPVFSLIGLPGEGAIVFITSMFLPLYAPIAIIATLALDMREITILALMCLISHNMFVESAIQKKTGSSFATMFILRIVTSFVAAFILNLLLPTDLGMAVVQKSLIVENSVLDLLVTWLKSAGILVLKISLIISGLMMLQNVLKEFKIINWLSDSFAPVMKIFGLSGNSSFLWLIGQIIGLTYGSAVMIEQVNHGEIEKKNANLLNYHLAINHSLLEDSLLFIAIGVPGLWIITPRIILAIIVVWTLHWIKRKVFVKSY